MKLVVSIFFPDGSRPTSNRSKIYDEEFADQILDQCEVGEIIGILMPSEILYCRILDFITGNAECFGGDYLHALLQEETFEADPATKTQLH